MIGKQSFLGKFLEKMDLELSEAEILEIQNTWKIPMADPLASGQAVYLKLFKRYPSNQLKFIDFKVFVMRI
uniref:Globin domain-containing protein n=1 Tax=Megaselia scalaris TaxID=36166 RepID=T1GF37_MEGSC